MLDSRFSYDAMIGSNDRRSLLDLLEGELAQRLSTAVDPAAEVLLVIHELRQLGHDIWSFDESDDFQAWCGDWTSPTRPWELVLEFRYPVDEPATVSAWFRDREAGGSAPG